MAQELLWAAHSVLMLLHVTALLTESRLAPALAMQKELPWTLLLAAAWAL